MKRFINAFSMAIYMRTFCNYSFNTIIDCCLLYINKTYFTNEKTLNFYLLLIKKFGLDCGNEGAQSFDI